MVRDGWECGCCDHYYMDAVKCKIMYCDIGTDAILHTEESDCCPSCFARHGESPQRVTDVLICDKCGAETLDAENCMFGVENDIGIYIECPECEHIEYLGD